MADYNHLLFIEVGSTLSGLMALHNYRLVLIILFVFVNFECKEKVIGDSGIKTPKDSTSATAKDKVRDSGNISKTVHYVDTNLKQRKDSTRTPVVDLKRAKVIEILSLTKDSDIWENTTQEDIKKCKAWSLTKNQIKSILREFEQVASEEINYGYFYWPCRLTGKLKIDTVTYEYFLNAGSFLTLVNDGSEVDFVHRGKKGEKFFLSGEIDMTVEEEKQLKKEGKYPTQ